MMRSLYSGVSGLKVHQTKMDVIDARFNNYCRVEQLPLFQVTLSYYTYVAVTNTATADYTTAGNYQKGETGK